MDQYDFFVQSMVASRTGEPAVTVTVNGADFTVNMSVWEARRLAASLIEAAESAEGDAFLVEFMQEKAGLDSGGVGAILHEYRNWKEERHE